MRLSEIQESASAGATGAGSICTNLAGGTPPKGQFFGGDPASSIYSTIKKHRKQRKEEVAESFYKFDDNDVASEDDKTCLHCEDEIKHGLWQCYCKDKERENCCNCGGSGFRDKVLEAKIKTAKQPAKPSGKAEVIGTTKPYKQPNVLSPTMKVKSTGKMLGGSEKKNPTLSTKFFGTCSSTNDPGNKAIIAELTYREFRNASNAISKICPTCSSPFKNIHDANQKFCSKECEGPGQIAEKLKEMWEKPALDTFISKEGKPVDVKTIRDLVKRVIDDSHGEMGMLQACLFVSGMMKNCSGWRIYFAIEDLTKKESSEMYGEK
jgi:hypothetical protein